MKQTQTILFGGMCVLLLLVSACATVNPRPDYDRTAQLITQATGQESVYRPDDEAVVKNTVDELLAGGVTAQEAVQLFLLNNPKLQAAFLNAGVARAEVMQAGLFSNPTLGFSPRFPDGSGPTSFEASLAQNIAELWRIPARTRAAEHSLEQAILELAHEVSSTALEAKAVYYKVVRTDREVAVIQDNVDITKQLVDLAKVREEAGVGSLIDVQLSESELLQMELTLRAATVARFEARTELTKLLGLPVPPDQLQLTDPLPDPPQWTVAPEQLITLARSHRLDVQAAQHAVLIWRLRKHEEESEEETAEKRAILLVGVTFLALALYVMYESVKKLILQEPPAESFVGILLALVSLIVMPVLAWQKRKVATEIASRALAADALEMLACSYLSLTLLLGLGLNVWMGWWWADPLAGLMMVFFLLREGWDAIEEGWKGSEK